MTIENLPFPTFDRKKSLEERTKKLILPEKLCLTDDFNAFFVPEGTEILCCTTQDFGFVFLPKGCKDENGKTVPRRIFKY